ncbi:rop-interactive crib motif-containing protein 4 [Datura stramonium]|uniref:Rop-interactive crib motif-containing protein 4 n=1 Tax=Datura stramonium TaxID=4076 RepID=A0ABS8VZ26_DATST|nr:rop-interactive crib motif-containing protein 4 [Datura stramonium]
MERFVLLPFSVGCISESSVAIGHHQQQQQHKSSSLHQLNLTPIKSPKEEKEDDEKNLEGENLKSPLGLTALPKFQRLFKNFKNLSHLFVDKDEIEEEEEEMGMEIGLPTDVKHVAHIGIDGATTTTTTSILRTNWDYHNNLNLNLNLKSPNNHDLLAQFPFANMANHSPNHTSNVVTSS